MTELYDQDKEGPQQYTNVYTSEEVLHLKAYDPATGEERVLRRDDPDVMTVREAVEAWEGTPEGQKFDTNEFLTGYDQGDPEKWAGDENYVILEDIEG